MKRLKIVKPFSTKFINLDHVSDIFFVENNDSVKIIYITYSDSREDRYTMQEDQFNLLKNHMTSEPYLTIKANS